MLSSPSVIGRRLSLPAALGAALLAASLAAQEAPPEEGEATEPQAAVLSSGSGSLVVGSDSRALPYATTAVGVLVALEPIVGRLGGRLEAGPLGQSYTLTLGETVVVIAPGSATLTQGTEIRTLSQPPGHVEHVLEVPLDLLARTYGELLGIEFGWDDAGKRLLVRQPAARDLPIEADIVHLQGVTTVVLRFPERPRYRVTQDGSVFEVILSGDRLVPPPPRAHLDDPLVRGLTINTERVRLELAPGAAADSYTLQQPFRIVFDVYRAAARDAAAGGVAAPANRETGPRAVRLIVVDPGHGGKETGAIGPSGATEKDLTLAIASALATRLEQTLRVRTVLTRTGDDDLALDDRSALANQNKADLFLSVHLNSSFGRGAAHGAETYFLSLQASDQRAADAATAENYVNRTAPGGAGDADLQLLLWDLAQSQHLARSQRLANLIQEELNRELDLKDRGVKQAPFRVLMGAAMPAVLVELGFINSPDEEKKLRDPQYTNALVEALVRAIGRYKAEIESGAEPTATSTAAPDTAAPPATPPSPPAP
jgi:N-acetylmuramoyl-L-alanine amidase